MPSKRQVAMVRLKSVIDQEPGCQIDNHGNRKFGDRLRFKFNTNKWRFERRGLGGNWILYRSEFYTKTTIGDITECLETMQYLKGQPGY